MNSLKGGWIVIAWRPGSALGRTSRISRVLLALAGSLGQGCTTSTHPDGNGNTTVLNFTTAINVAMSYVGTIDPRFELELRAYYERPGSAPVAIGNQTITLASTGSQTEQVSLPMDLTSCSFDKRSTCPVRIVLVLWLVNNGVALDYQWLGPFTLSPGKITTLPEEVAVAEIVGFDVVPPAPTVSVGGTVPLTALFFTIAADTVARPVQWRSETPQIATVDTVGVVTGIAAGRSTIVAHWGEGQASFGVYVQVTAPPSSP